MTRLIINVTPWTSLNLWLILPLLLFGKILLGNGQRTNTRSGIPGGFRPSWAENWYDHRQSLALATSTFNSRSNVTLYLDIDAHRYNQRHHIANNILRHVSDAWGLAKSMYSLSFTGQGQDPRLYIIIHYGKYYGLHRALYTEKSHGFRNVIDCGQPTPAQRSFNRHQCTSSMLVPEVAHFVNSLIIPKPNSKILNSSIIISSLYSQWRFFDFVRYITLYRLRAVETAQEYLKSVIDNTNNFPQNGIKLMRHWYIPIFTEFRLNSSRRSRRVDILNFYNIVYSIANQTSAGAGANLALTPGAFVHLWSQAVGEDLRDLAYTAFGWTPDFEIQFQEARTKFPAEMYRKYTRNYKETYPNSKSTFYSPPKLWREHWHGHTANMKLTPSDSHVALYFTSSTGPTMNNVNWPLGILSAAWDHARWKYGPFGPDPYLYLILHNNENSNNNNADANVNIRDGNGNGRTTNPPNNNCILTKNSYWDQVFGNRKVIDCWTTNEQNAWNSANETDSNRDHLLEQLATIIQEKSKEKERWPRQKIPENVMNLTTILVYDMYLGINRSDEADRYRRKHTNGENIFGGTNWFRDWYLPIYNRYGGSDAINRYLTQVNMYWPEPEPDESITSRGGGQGMGRMGNRGRGGTEENCVWTSGDNPQEGINTEFNLGEFVHFWSGVVGYDLRDLAYKEFGWCGTHRDQFEEAKLKFSYFNYTDSFPSKELVTPPQEWEEHWSDHTEKLNLVHFNNHVAFYLDADVNDRDPTMEKWPFEIISEAWQYAKEKYGPLSPDPVLYIILHTTVKHEGCIVSKSESYIDKTFDHRLVIDCGFELNSLHLSSSSRSTVSTPSLATTVNTLINGIATVVQRSAQQTGNFPGCDMTEILVYDIYIGLKRDDYARSWLNDKENQTTFCFKQNVGSNFESAPDSLLPNFQAKKSFWFRDFFLPIHQKYNGSETLNKFFHLLYRYWPTTGPDYNEELSLGQYVHFWSGAAGENLEPIARKFIDFSQVDDAELPIARLHYHQITYRTAEQVPNPDRHNSNSSSSGSPLPLTLKTTKQQIIIYISAAVAAIILLLALFCLHRWKINNLKEQIRKLTEAEVKAFFEGSVRIKNQDKITKTYTNTNSSTSTDDEIAGNAFIESQPFNTNFEIQRDQLEISTNRILGSGEFGIVYHGVLKKGACEDDDGVDLDRTEAIEVAVKIPKPHVDVTTFKSLLTELKLISHLGRHENIVALLGVVTANIENRELFVTLEFCPKGDLRRHLRKNSANFQDMLLVNRKGLNIDEINEDEPLLTVRKSFIPLQVFKVASFKSKAGDGIEKRISTLNLFEWAEQIANGMSFISSKNVIHGDLAARNVLLTADNVVKISDFGLSRQLINSSNYTKSTQSQTPLPWRWMAIESLRDGAFSVKSDVWAFGVTLFEIFTLGKTPYPGQKWTYDFMDQLDAGLRLPQPKFGNIDLSTLMLDCMWKKPSKRLSFPDISNRLRNIKTDLFPESGESMQKHSGN